MCFQRNDYLSFFILGLHLLHPQRDSSVSIGFFFWHILCIFWEIILWNTAGVHMNLNQNQYKLKFEVHYLLQLLCHGSVCSTSSFSCTAFHLLLLTMSKIYISLSPHSFNGYFPCQQFSSPVIFIHAHSYRPVCI